MKHNLGIIILAAGKGKRMNSRLPKVLHKLCGKPMLSYSIDTALSLRPGQIILVVGDDKEKIIDYIKTDYKKEKIKVVQQKKLCGTADAVLSAKSMLSANITDLLVLYGDQPLLTKETVKNLLNTHYKNNSVLTLLTAEIDDATGYGRVLRDKANNIIRICEDLDLTWDNIELKEVNAGSCVFKKKELLRVIKDIKPDNKKKEYYLTDVVGLFYRENKKISSASASSSDEVLGVNSRSDLVDLEQILNQRTINKFLDNGVTVSSPQTTFINHDVRIGKDTVIKPFVYIDSEVEIGKNCTIGPFCHIRGGSKIADNVIVGSFAELNRVYAGNNTRIKHFSYLGDIKLGNNVNVGAGVVTANFDGKNKNKTVVADNAFIGSDTILVAPVRVGKSAVTGAGSVVTKHKNVPDKAIAFGVPAKLYKKGKDE
ncbi:MAG TPA: bifunctional N-acetylglucosamine-1-phosphate uridyltransferase/glucosamine-1-phosphate acetyltransferase [Candidatus Omnitrophica bacterium]|nr:bifunctional N-acetylglucosamine-1-phosphate uridyltransferase/glucosamine-1-phosphate acetyltransferase [Candidatus Omnitrophota bacterium]